MKVLFCLFCFILSAQVFSQVRRTVIVNYGASHVYCDEWIQRNGKRGYSIYRHVDGQDIGTGIYSDQEKCKRAAATANHSNQGVVCTPKNSGYAVFRIKDNRLIGHDSFSSYADCLFSTRYAKSQVICAPYTDHEGRKRISMWDIPSGKDIGRNVYTRIGTCYQSVK